ncbi:16S rRNA (guanine(966)-N(2))-methyltransferase RsmD [Alteribacillus persepolensis]|uniref:16S rRNA (Guanine(966)-N(2))-methyltransferase RsmD n=1 Tax=Alteribacillus persepolensis TaxID=568899 RepID=A0A1G7YDS2_9BACI|nr:16S rRNA (guanine(966)-N(2))-methyltransferase RsmD [Alteribacillus persepolensis]SDG94476.1 16S rRNA (guanine(966)-N(2))-methyltransferase RsmD [Alteribacillus persepolensis]
MRVISGTAKGVILKAVPGMKTRPTSDKVKEALFHRIGPYFRGGAGLDLYAGTGSLGIEALSRGFDSFVFVDKSPQAVKIIRQNVKAASFEQSSRIYRNDTSRALSALEKRNEVFDLICMDPPYDYQQLAEMLTTIYEKGLLRLSGYAICEHRSSVELPDYVSGLSKQQAHTYGDTAVSIYGFDHEGGNIK